MIERPNIEEMETLLVHTGRQRFYSALSLLELDTTADGDPLTTADVMKLGLVDWLSREHLLTELGGVATVKAFGHPISCLALKYDELEQADDKRLKRPAAGFTVLDNYAAVMPQPYHSRGYYIVETGEWTYTLPQLALTAVTCDFSVLVLNLLTTMRQTREPAG